MLKPHSPLWRYFIRALPVSLQQYSTPLKCPICWTEDDTNTHLGFCASVLPALNKIITEYKFILQTLIILHADSRR